MSSFPITRLRRLRRTARLRRMVSETRLTSDILIQPQFVLHGRGMRQPIPSMPGVFQLSVDELLSEVSELEEIGIGAVILFGIPALKDEAASESFASDGIIQQAVRAIKKAIPEMMVITDVCLCEYTTHGHCGLLDGERIANDRTLEVMGRVAVSHAEAGADIIAPSGMMDGMVYAIRRALDETGFEDIAILSYAAKYASGFYGPFRDAAESAPAFGDRKSHQLDPANVREARREIELDLAEGADMVMVKPALPYLDVIRMAREIAHVPLWAYNVSGEYAMVKAAAERGWLDERRVVLELLTAIRRAGADLIISYYAKDASRWLREGYE